MARLRSILQAFVLLIGMASAAVAGPYEDALPKFAADSYSDTEAAIGAVAGSGHPLSLKLVEALRDGQLLIAGGQVYCGLIGAASRQEYTAIGRAVNLAARLMQAAGPGPGAGDRAFGWSPRD